MDDEFLFSLSKDIIPVGFIGCWNYCTYAAQQDEWDVILIVKQAGNSVSLYLCLQMIERDELAVYYINPDGSDGCWSGFAAREYTVGDNVDRFHGVLVCLVTIYTLTTKTRQRVGYITATTVMPSPK